MRKIIFLLGGLFVTVLVCIVVIMQIRKKPPEVLENTLAKVQQQEPPVVPEDTIVLVRRHITWACGYHNKGEYIDSNGKVYAFEFTYGMIDGEESPYAEPQDLYEKISEQYQTAVSVRNVDQEMIAYIWGQIPDIDVNAEMSMEGNACDMGQREIYVVDREGKMILIDSYGDYISNRQDQASKTIMDIYNELEK